MTDHIPKSTIRQLLEEEETYRDYQSSKRNLESTKDSLLNRRDSLIICDARIQLLNQLLAL